MRINFWIFEAQRTVHVLDMPAFLGKQSCYFLEKKFTVFPVAASLVLAGCFAFSSAQLSSAQPVAARKFSMTLIASGLSVAA